MLVAVDIFMPNQVPVHLPSNTLSAVMSILLDCRMEQDCLCQDLQVDLEHPMVVTMSLFIMNSLIFP